MDPIEITRPRQDTTTFRNLIGGKPMDAGDGRTIDVVSPSDGAVFTTIPRSGAAEIDRAVKAARKAFEEVWSRFTAIERGRLLMKLGEAILSRADELGALDPSHRRC